MKRSMFIRGLHLRIQELSEKVSTSSRKKILAIMFIWLQIET